jgi:hypothetical protein
MIGFTRKVVVSVLAALTLALATAGSAGAKGIRITEKGAPGATVQVFLTTTLGGKHIQLKQQNGKPWDLKIGPNGTGSLDFGSQINVQDPNGNNLTVPSSVVTDFDQYYKGIRIGGGPVPFAPLPQIDPDATTALQGGYLGSGPTFVLNPLTDFLPDGPNYVPMPDFVCDIDGSGTITASDDIYVAVNMSLWEPVAQSFTDGTVVNVVNGVSSALPGYYFSLGPISFDENTGWTSSSPLTGDAISVAEHQLSSTPEPSAWAALAIGGLGLLIVSRRRAKRPGR